MLPCIVLVAISSITTESPPTEPKISSFATEPAPARANVSSLRQQDAPMPARKVDSFRPN
jgi:hypothetical protein